MSKHCKKYLKFKIPCAIIKKVKFPYTKIKTRNKNETDFQML